MVENINTIANLTSVIAPPVQPPSLVAALQAFITGSSVPNVPQAILQSPAGQLITAVVIAANPKGQVLLQTPQGQVVFNSALPLTVGQQLTLETLTSQGQQRVPGAPPPPPSSLPLDVRLVKVNGVAAESVFPQAATTATNTAETAAKTQPQQIQPAINGLFLRAVFPQTPKPIQQNASTSSLYDAEAVEYDPSPLQSRATFKATVLSTPTPNAPSGGQNTEVDSYAPMLAPIEGEEPLPQLKAGDVVTLKITGGNLVSQAGAAPAVAMAIQPSPTTVPLLSTAFIEAEQPVVPPSLTAPAPSFFAENPPPSANVPGMDIMQQFIAGTGNVKTEQIAQAFATPIQTPTSTSLPFLPAEETPVAFAAFAAPSTSPAPPTQAVAAAPNTLSGVVIAQEADGSAIVQTSIATLRLPSEVPLPKGTELAIQITEIEKGPDIFVSSQLPRSFQTGNLATDALVKGTTALDTLFKQVSGLNSDTAKEAVREIIPQPGKQFGNKILQFMESVKQDSLPDTIRQLLPKAIVEQLGLSRSAPEFSSLKTAMAEAPPPQWSFMLVPVMQGDEMQHMRWFKRKQEREDYQKEGGDGTRFVVELETKSLGAIQLDGLFFNQPKNKEFDLVVRSQKEFSSEEQQQIARIYNNYGEITGYRGSLRFEQTPTFPVQPLNDIIAGEHREISA